jgi:hypothetical protein
MIDHGWPHQMALPASASLNGGYKTIGEFCERKQFAALFDDAVKRKFDCVLFWAVERAARIKQILLFFQENETGRNCPTRSIALG